MVTSNSMRLISAKDANPTLIPSLAPAVKMILSGFAGMPPSRRSMNWATSKRTYETKCRLMKKNGKKRRKGRKKGEPYHVQACTVRIRP